MCSPCVQSSSSGNKPSTPMGSGKHRLGPPALPACPYPAGTLHVGGEPNPQASPAGGGHRVGNRFFQGQWLLSVLNLIHRLLSSLLHPGLAGNGFIFRYQKSYFYFITYIIAAQEDKSRVLSSPQKTYSGRDP